MADSAELVELAETVDGDRKPTKAMEFSPQVTQFFNITGFLEIFRSFYGMFRGATKSTHKFWRESRDESGDRRCRVSCPFAA